MDRYAPFLGFKMAASCEFFFTDRKDFLSLLLLVACDQAPNLLPGSASKEARLPHVR